MLHMNGVNIFNLSKSQSSVFQLFCGKSNEDSRGDWFNVSYNQRRTLA